MTTESEKQRAEVEAWLTMRAQKGDAFLRDVTVTGDLSVYKDCAIADIGCGPRPFLEFFPIHAGFMFDCCMSAYAREGLLQADRNKVLCADAMVESIPIRSEALDHVFALNMLDHVLEPPAAVAEFHRVLKPWGYVHLHVDLGGEPNPCEPNVFTARDIDGLFGRFELIYSEERPPSNPSRSSSVIRMYRKRQADGTSRSALALPHGDPPPALSTAAARHLRCLACPSCRGELEAAPDAFACRACGQAYTRHDGIARLVVPAGASSRRQG